MRYLIEHHTTLNFELPVFEQAVELRLLPREESYQKVLDFKIEVEPEAKLFHYQDAYGNHVHYFSEVPKHDRLKIRFRAEVENTLRNPFDFIPPSPREERKEIERLLREQPRLNDFVLSVSEIVPPLAPLASVLPWPVYNPERELLGQLQEAMRWVAEHFTYLPGATEVHCPFLELLDKRSGVCQDFAHLLLAIVRHWGFPARYVMGYQHLAPAAESEVYPATHAWVEVYLPGGGWLGFDATQQLLANDGYIPVAVGRDSRDAAPQRGCYKGGGVGREPLVELRVVGQQ